MQVEARCPMGGREMEGTGIKPGKIKQEQLLMMSETSTALVEIQPEERGKEERTEAEGGNRKHLTFVCVATLMVCGSSQARD